MKKRLFIMEREERSELVKEIIMNHGAMENIEITAVNESGVIPEDYDAYLVHLGLTGEEPILELRREFPHKPIRITYLAGIFFVPAALRDIYYTYDDKETIREVLSQLGVLKQ